MNTSEYIQFKLQSECNMLTIPKIENDQPMNYMRNQKLQVIDSMQLENYEKAYKIAYKATLYYEKKVNIVVTSNEKIYITSACNEIKIMMRKIIEKLCLESKKIAQPTYSAPTQNLYPSLDGFSINSVNPVTAPPAKSLPTASALGEIYVPTGLINNFVQATMINTKCNKETCGLLCGKRLNGVLTISTIIIPKQEGSSDSCIMTNEEELLMIQDKEDLITMGWIHTHPAYVWYLPGCIS